MKKKLSLWKIILITLLSVLLLGAASIATVGGYLSNKVERVEIDRSELTNVSNSPVELDDIITIALFGTDYSGEEVGAADSTMILTIDKKNNKMKLLSLMRDIYLDLPDGSEQMNLNYTMSSGGPSLILQTINYNFNLNIDKFIQVDLRSLPTIIDKLGGVEMTITDDEIEHINMYITQMDKNNGSTTELITSSGNQLLNGTQASAYCRVRYTEGRDFKRTERQRDVLTALFNKMKNVSITEAVGIIPDLLPLVSTNMSNTEIMSIASKVSGMDISNIEQERFPLDGDHNMVLTDMYHMLIDKEKTTEEIHNFIFSN